MCLAVPMQVKEIRGLAGDAWQPPTAIVEADGVWQEARLDIVDRFPAVGDYVIVHAGFALHTLDEQQARENLALLANLANAADETR
ncbi:MAG: HypC/HybG/HupF family hydrogenase formation chaperone [Deltaproteobacteria bacterium]|nr:HypC/HybG/HupF family hydrogenase formation chaperone [Deltaproteobacteria bacterium]